jgi:hypothetical protein
MSETNRDHPLELLSAYLDDELPVEERAPIDRHLALCPDCRDQLESLRHLSRAIAEEAVPPPPDELEARVLGRLDALAVVPMRRRRFVIPATIAATIAAASLVAVVTWKQGGVGWPPRQEGDTRRAGTERVRDKVAANAPVPSAEPAGPIQTPPAPPPAPPPVEQPAVAPDRKPAGAVAKEKRSDFAFDKDAGQPGTSDQGVLGGAVSKDEKAVDALGRLAGGAPAAPAISETRTAFKSAMPPCPDAADDSGVAAAWEVADLAAAVRDLEALAISHGGRLERPGAAPEATFAVVLPRARYDEFAAAARGMGLVGLNGAPVGAGGGCIRQRIAIRPVSNP